MAVDEVQKVDRVYPKDEVERALGDFSTQLLLAASSNQWAPLVALFTDDVHLDDKVSGPADGRHALSVWLLDGVEKSPYQRYDVTLTLIDGNRVCAVVRADGAPDLDFLDVNVLLHYAGDGRWSHVEVAYA